MSISIADYKRTKPVEVDLWGHLFEYVFITKLTESKVNETIDKINKDFAGEDLTKHAVQAKAFAARMDVRLKKSAGGKKKASALIKEKWASADLTMPQVDRFWEAVEQAVESPTSTTGPIAIESFAGATVEVNLWGTPFEAIEVTSVTEPAIDEQIAAIAEEFAGKELTHEVQVQIFGARFDARLKPAEGDAKASDIVFQQWEAGEVEVPQLQQFWEAVLEEINRPS